MAYSSCILAGCPRQPVLSRGDGLCYEHGAGHDRAVEISELQAALRRDETPATESIVKALDYLLERAKE